MTPITFKTGDVVYLVGDIKDMSPSGAHENIAHKEEARDNHTLLVLAEPYGATAHCIRAKLDGSSVRHSGLWNIQHTGMRLHKKPLIIIV